MADRVVAAVHRVPAREADEMTAGVQRSAVRCRAYLDAGGRVLAPALALERAAGDLIAGKQRNHLGATLTGRFDWTHGEAVADALQDDLMVCARMPRARPEPSSKQSVERVARLPRQLGDVHRDLDEVADILATVRNEGRLALRQAGVALPVEEQDRAAVRMRDLQHPGVLAGHLLAGQIPGQPILDELRNHGVKCVPELWGNPKGWLESVAVGAEPLTRRATEFARPKPRRATAANTPPIPPVTPLWRSGISLLATSRTSRGSPAISALEVSASRSTDAPVRSAPSCSKARSNTSL